LEEIITCPLSISFLIPSIFIPRGLPVFFVATSRVAIFLPATADAPDDLEHSVFGAVDRNAEQIAIVGDVLYDFAETGMQEHESWKM
jgi:hypothetical protein